jgi:hypothetical protein
MPYFRGLNLIISPEGTRSLTRKRIVPVACNNSAVVYPCSSPIARSGRIIYRIGEPLSVDDQLRAYRIDEPFSLFTRGSQQRHREQFEGVTRIVMASIESMLDEKYRRGYAAM